MFHSWNRDLITSHKPFSPSSLFKQSFPFPKFIVNWKLKEFVQLSFKIVFLGRLTQFCFRIDRQKKLLWCLFGVQISFKISLIHVHIYNCNLKTKLPETLRKIYATIKAHFFMEGTWRPNWVKIDIHQIQGPYNTGLLLFIFSSEVILDFLSNVKVCYDSPFEKL